MKSNGVSVLVTLLMTILLLAVVLILRWLATFSHLF